MKYVKSAISENRATMYFDYGENRFYVIQEKRTGNNLINNISDRRKTKEVYNSLLKTDLLVEKATTENGEIELNVNIVKGDSFYQLFGIMDEDEFEKIVTEVYVEN